MWILIDTREQYPLGLVCDVKFKGLKFGDYGCMFSETYQYPVVFERKGIGDLFSSLTQGYDRLRKCFERAKKANFTLIIVIEGTKEKILKGYAHSARDPKSIIKQLETIERKYGVTHMFFPSRISMAHYITDYYTEKYLEWRNKEDEKNDTG